MREARRRKEDPKWRGQSPPRGERGREQDWLLEKQEGGRGVRRRPEHTSIRRHTEDIFFFILQKVIGTH